MRQLYSMDRKKYRVLNLIPTNYFTENSSIRISNTTSGCKPITRHTISYYDRTSSRRSNSGNNQLPVAPPVDANLFMGTLFNAFLLNTVFNWKLNDTFKWYKLKAKIPEIQGVSTKLGG